MDPVVATLMAWIAAHTDYRTDTVVPPEVVQLTAEELTREYYTGVAHLIPEDGVDERVNALYAATDGEVGTVYIMRAAELADAGQFSDPMDNPIWREILLHELVHHVQWQTGEAETWACPAAGEKEAYRLGGVYLRQVGATDPIPNRNFWAHMYARC